MATVIGFFMSFLKEYKIFNIAKENI